MGGGRTSTRSPSAQADSKTSGHSARAGQNIDKPEATRPLLSTPENDYPQSTSFKFINNYETLQEGLLTAITALAFSLSVELPCAATLVRCIHGPLRSRSGWTAYGMRTVGGANATEIA